MGRLESTSATPADQPDRMKQAVKNEHQDDLRQVNAEEVTDQRGATSPTAEKPAQQHADAADPSRLPPPAQIDHSMLEEEPDGWDLAPTDIHNPRERRHPRTEGKGGTP